MATPPTEPATPARPQPPSVVGLEMHSGPLPSPKILAAYEQAYPRTAERIIAMAELDQKAEIRDIWFERRARFVVDLIGQLFLYALVLAAVYLAMNNKPLEAFFAGLAPIAVAIYANTRKKPIEIPDDEH